MSSYCSVCTCSSLCWVCNTPYEHPSGCLYKSHVNLIYAGRDRGLWSLGSNLILKDKGPQLPTLEAPNIQLVEEQTSIPVPHVVKSWEEDQHTLTLMKRIPGEPLNRAWPKLSADEKENIANQTVGYLDELRKLQSDQIQTPGGGPVYSNFLFSTTEDDVPHGPLASDDELWAEMEQGLGDIPEAVRTRLRSRMPSATPYTFTHGDLTDMNIMVKDGAVTGIIDWETSGYFPVWWEYVFTLNACSEEDEEWKVLLRKHMPDYSAASDWWLDYYCLSRDPSSERAMNFIKETCAEAD